MVLGEGLGEGEVRVRVTEPIAVGESSGSRGVMGGVGQVRGVESEPGQLRGVSSLATERASPATEG